MRFPLDLFAGSRGQPRDSSHDDELRDEVGDAERDEDAVHEELRPREAPRAPQDHQVHDARQREDVRQPADSTRKPEMDMES